MSAPYFEKCQEDRPRPAGGSRGAQAGCAWRVCEVGSGLPTVSSTVSTSHVFESFHNKMMGGGKCVYFKKEIAIQPLIKLKRNGICGP